MSIASSKTKCLPSLDGASLFSITANRFSISEVKIKWFISDSMPENIAISECEIIESPDFIIPSNRDFLPGDSSILSSRTWSIRSEANCLNLVLIGSLESKKSVIK